MLLAPHKSRLFYFMRQQGVANIVFATHSYLCSVNKTGT